MIKFGIFVAEMAILYVAALCMAFPVIAHFKEEADYWRKDADRLHKECDRLRGLLQQSDEELQGDVV